MNDEESPIREGDAILHKPSAMSTKKIKPKNEPLPCPFCGQSPGVYQHEIDETGTTVTCDNFDCHVVGLTVWGADLDQAVARWNHRLKPQ